MRVVDAQRVFFYGQPGGTYWPHSSFLARAGPRAFIAGFCNGILLACRRPREATSRPPLSFPADVVPVIPRRAVVP